MNPNDIQLEERLKKLENELNTFRTGRDGSQLKLPLDSFSQKIIQNIIIQPVSVRLASTTAATAANYSHFFIADQGYIVLAAYEVHAIAGSDSGSVTLQIEKLTGTTAPGSGISLLATGFNLKGTANTVQFADFSGAGGLNTIIRGDRLALKRSGTLTAVDDLVVTVYLQKL